MKQKIVLCALFLAAVVWLSAPQASRGEAETFRVSATAYTCDPHRDNPVNPCGPLRWGGNNRGWGMACPVAWKNRVFEVPGYGNLRCDDTGRYDYWDGLPHIDIRVPTWAQARRFGIQRITIRAVGYAQTTQTSGTIPAAPAPAQDVPVAPASTAVQTPEAAVNLALGIAPNGDGSTAMARLVRGVQARQLFPSLFEGVNMSDNDPVWLVTLWVPPTEIPGDATIKPNPAGPVAARFFAFDAQSGNPITGSFVAVEALEAMGSLASDETISLQ
jgi:hypothetical protein